MVEYLLGNFMVNSGMITADDLKRVIEKQDKARVKLGLIAVSEGYMTVGQADEVNYHQTVMDKKFGDIAIEKGYLSGKQVEELLEKQGNEYLVFVQTLIDEDIIGLGEMDAVLNGYQIENGFTNEQMEIFKSADADRIIEMFLPKGVSDNYRELAIMAFKMVIRSIDRHAYIGIPYITDKYDAVMPVTQRLYGDRLFETAVADVDGGMCKVASVFGRIEFDELDEDVQDACGEFLNCINGLYVSGLSWDGIELELEPPQIHSDCTLSSDRILVLPICTKGRNYDFIVTENEWR